MLKQPDTLYDFGLTGGEKPGDDYKFCALVRKSQNSVVSLMTQFVTFGRSFRI